MRARGIGGVGNAKTSEVVGLCEDGGEVEGAGLVELGGATRGLGERRAMVCGGAVWRSDTGKVGVTAGCDVSGGGGGGEAIWARGGAVS